MVMTSLVISTAGPGEVVRQATLVPVAKPSKRALVVFVGLTGSPVVGWLRFLVQMEIMELLVWRVFRPVKVIDVD